MMKFSDPQNEELRNIARIILKSQKLDEQSWDDAWSGNFPVAPTPKEIDALFCSLKQEIARLSKYGVTDEDYATVEKRTRMIYLESCKSIDIWTLSETGEKEDRQ